MTRFLLASALIFGAAFPAPAQDRGGIAYAPVAVIDHPLPPITNPKIVPAEQADISDEELVIGVEVGGEARAYSINQLTGPRREIINDTLGGVAIAATW